MDQPFQPHPLLADTFGLAPDLRRIDPAGAREVDRRLDAALARFDWRALHAATPARRVMLLVPAYPLSPDGRRRLLGRLRVSTGRRHRITITLDDRADVSRLRKIDEAMAGASACDWLLVIDDDVALGAQFLDRFIAAAEAATLAIVQPAHRLHSFASYALTQRSARSIVRSSNFVEIGPVLAIRSGMFGVLPLPASRWGWGVDMLWAEQARRFGWRLGIVDGAPVEHLRPVNFDLPERRPLREASALLERDPPSITRRMMLGGDRIVIGF